MELEIHLRPFGNPPRIIFYCLHVAPAKALNKVFEKEKGKEHDYTAYSVFSGTGIPAVQDSDICPVQSITSIMSSQAMLGSQQCLWLLHFMKTVVL